MEDKTLKVKKSGSDFVFIGLALFAMFFGAGNLIFPPDIGVRSGPEWFIGFLCFFIADAGLAILGVVAMVRADGKIENVTGPIGAKAATILNTAVILCIGPGLAIPRTAATTFELGVSPVFGIAPTAKLPLAIFSVVFFSIVLALTIRPSKVVDIVGKFLTPILVTALVILIIVGFVSPKGDISTPIEGTSTIRDGILNGYQTMDAMASIFFAIIVITAIYSKGYSGKKESTNIALKSSVIAGILLFIVYGGLAYLGATTGTQWKEMVALGPDNGGINQAGLLINITDSLLGKAGVILLGVVVALACLTTAIGLTSSAAEYFTELTNGKLKYKTMVIVIALFSAFVCNLGLSQIISVAAPILTLVYPLIVLMIITSLFRKYLRKVNIYRCGAIAAFVVSLLSVLNDQFKVGGLSWIHDSLPLDIYGFNWIVPTLIAMVIGYFIPGKELEN